MPQQHAGSVALCFVTLAFVFYHFASTDCTSLGMCCICVPQLWDKAGQGTGSGSHDRIELPCLFGRCSQGSSCDFRRVTLSWEKRAGSKHLLISVNRRRHGECVYLDHDSLRARGPRRREASRPGASTQTNMSCAIVAEAEMKGTDT